MSKYSWRVERLLETLQLLASDAETQVEVFPKFVHVPDEIASAFDECFLMVEEHCMDEVSKAQMALLIEMDAILDKLSSPENRPLWSVAAMRESQEWETVRVKARELLQAFDRTPERPQLEWMIFVNA